MPTIAVEANRSQRSVGPEPWFYRYIEWQTNFAILIGILQIVLLIALGFVVIVSGTASGVLQRSGVQGVLATTIVWIIVVFAALMGFLVQLFTYAFFLLAVDASRNLRKILRELRDRA